jgi:hypothetical protein
MSLYICNYCKKEYSSKRSLDLHQKTAKFCLRIRNNHEEEKTSFNCEYCNDNFILKHVYERHYETCKIRLQQIIKDELQKKEEFNYKLQEELKKKEEIILKLKEEINEYKTELRVKDEQLKMKDEIIKEFKNEVYILKQESKETYDKIFEKEEKLVDTLLHHNNSMNKNCRSSNIKTISNNLTINNYGIKPLTQESIIEAFDSYNSKNKNAFNGYVYDMITGDYVSFKVEIVFYGLIKELRDYYGITDISREKVMYNNNGEMTLTTVQEFIRTNVVMNNIEIMLEWIMNLQTQIKERKEEGRIENNGEIREMTEIEKRDLTDKANTLEYIYKMFKISKEKGHPNEFMSKFLSQGAIEHGKVIGKASKIPSLKLNLDD